MRFAMSWKGTKIKFTGKFSFPSIFKLQRIKLRESIICFLYWTYIYFYFRTHIFYLDYSYGAQNEREESKDTMDKEDISASNHHLTPESFINDVTLVAQLSMDRLHMVEDLCRWKIYLLNWWSKYAIVLYQTSSHYSIYLI